MALPSRRRSISFPSLNGRIDQESSDEEVPHHPSCGREPEEAVAFAQVHMERKGLEVFEEDAAVSMYDRLRQPCGAGRVEYPEWMVERDGLELDGIGIDQRVPPENGVGEGGYAWVVGEIGNDDGRFEGGETLLEVCDFVDLGEVFAAVPIAVCGDQRLWLDLAKSVDDAPSAELGRAR